MSVKFPEIVSLDVATTKVDSKAYADPTKRKTTRSLKKPKLFDKNMPSTAMMVEQVG